MGNSKSVDKKDNNNDNQPVFRDRAMSNARRVLNPDIKIHVRHIAFY
jgi:hypothetical protein